MIWVQYLVFGVGVGAMFSLLAAGIVLVYRASGVLNFAHATTGVFAAYVNFELLERFAWMPVSVALVAALLTGALTAVAAQRLVFSPLREASQVTKLLVSFGVAGVLQGAIGLIWSRLGTPGTAKSLFPVQRSVEIAGARVPYQRVGLIVLGVVVTVALTALVQRTSFGIQVRALAQNRLAARLAGINEARVEMTTWALAGATAALAAVLLIPFGVLNPLSLMGVQLKALAVALVGGFVSLPAALVGGLGLGTAQELLAGAPAPLNGLSGALATGLVVVLLLTRVERFFVSDQEAKAIQGQARSFGAGRGRLIIGSARTWSVAFAVVGVLVLMISGFWAFVTARTLVYALLGLSLVVLTGWSGQVSLMPGTFAGVGACLAWVLSERLGYPFLLVLPLASLATVPVCAFVGFVALRLRPLYLAVATVALAGLFEETLFRQDWFANGGQPMTVVRPGLIEGDRAFALATVLIVGALFAFTAVLGRSRTGRAFAMVRDNPDAAAANGVNPVKYRLAAFGLSAFFAGMSGVLFAYLLQTYSSAAFGFLILSLAAFGLAVVGGIRSPIGPAIGAFGFVFLTEVFRSSGSVSDWSVIGLGVGIVVVLARDPDGIVGLLSRLARRRGGVDDDAVTVDLDELARPDAPTPLEVLHA
ncbi:MAG TPA: ABC transporter permease [Acidimicrobiia bacterium]|nr:ABC transporter permease [Acidimicrobiia bacterium]